MNYEQRYKEALKAVKELQEANPSDDGIKNWVEEKFPELKESGDYDERIRKALIDGFKRYDYGALFNGCFVREILPWLEKQGEQKTIWHNEDEEPQKGSLILLIMQSGTPIVAKIIEANHTFNHGERWTYIDDLLEKQGASYTKRDVDNAYVEGMAFAKEELEKQGEANPYSGVSFEYNGHTWGMCARDGGVEILMDSELKAFVSLNKSFVYPIHPQPDLAPKTALESIKGGKANALQSVEWSEEDERAFHHVLSVLEEYGEEHPSNSKFVCNWLKSIKARMGGG